MFDRLLKIVSNEELERLHNLNILIVGLGGVGGYALEALTRIGVLNFTLVDNDKVDITNLNRQIISLRSNIGKSKVLVAKDRVIDINPDANIKTIDKFIMEDNIDILFKEKYDYIIDACDTITTKVLLIKKAKESDIPIISIMGTGNRFDPTKLEIKDIYRTNNDPLAKIMRKLLKENGIKKQDVVFSNEIPVKISDRVPGSTSLVPSVAGIYAAYYVVKNVLNK